MRQVYTRATLGELPDGGRRVVGSTIDITERVELVADDLQLTAAFPGVPDEVPPGRYARIRVEDDGGGVAPDV